MSKHQIIADGTSLHGRSIRAALDLLEESQSRSEEHTSELQSQD